jgi:hypothetical protein
MSWQNRVDVLDWLPAGLEPVNAHIGTCTLVHPDGAMSAAFRRYYHQTTHTHHHHPHTTHAAFQGQLLAAPVFRRFVSADRIRWQSVGNVAPGTYAFTYGVIAITPGSFVVPATLVTSATLPDVMGSTQEHTFQVSIA